jgi:2-polyprenyl-3-methyl-5-hydroxy-6-metoxy-1,4-benzoquinol methylase
MIHYDICPLCSSSEISHFQTCTDYFVSKEVFDIYRCTKCGFIFIQDHPEESEIGRYYESDDYISHSDTSRGLTDKAYQVTRGIMLGKKKRMIKKITGLSSGNILDIGSGTGHFLNTMKNSGWEISGVEINPKAREYAASRFDIDTISPENISTLPGNYFDCITLWHVLEHLQEPFKYMEEIARLLKNDGVCIVALPNSNSFDSKHYGKEWAAYDVPRHLWHFNPSTFTIFAGKNRLAVAEKRKLPLDVFYISILSEKYKGSKFALLTGTLNGIGFLIRSWFVESGNSSIVYILKKSADQ